MYETSVGDIMRELEERLRDPGFIGNTGTSGNAGSTRGAVGSDGEADGKLADAAPVDQDHPPAPWRIRDLIREWFRDRISSRSRSKQ